MHECYQNKLRCLVVYEYHDDPIIIMFKYFGAVKFSTWAYLVWDYVSIVGNQYLSIWGK